MANKLVLEIVDEISKIATDPTSPEPVVQWATGIANRLCRAAETQVPENMLKGYVLPSSVGELADLYAETRELRLSMDKEAAAVKSRETEIYNVIMSILDESPDTGAAGQHHRVQRVVKNRVNVNTAEDGWDKFYAFVRENDAFEMLQKRLSDKAVADWAEAKGELPAGLQSVEVPTLSFSKV